MSRPPQDPTIREEYRKNRLAHYNALAREIWGRAEGEARMHVFAMATFGDAVMVDDGEGGHRPSIARVPLDEWMDEEMVTWLNRCRNAKKRQAERNEPSGHQA